MQSKGSNDLFCPKIPLLTFRFYPFIVQNLMCFIPQVAKLFSSAQQTLSTLSLSTLEVHKRAFAYQSYTAKELSSS